MRGCSAAGTLCDMTAAMQTCIGRSNMVALWCLHGCAQSADLCGHVRQRRRLASAEKLPQKQKKNHQRSHMTALYFTIH